MLQQFLRKWKYASLVMYAIYASLSGWVCAAAEVQRDASRSEQKVSDYLPQEWGDLIVRYQRNGIIQSFRMKEGVRITKDEFWQREGYLWNLEEGNEVRENVESAERAESSNKASYRQFYNGVPVEGTGLLLQLNERGEVDEGVVNLVQYLSPDTNASISSDYALKVAMDAIGSNQSEWDENLGNLPEGNLIIGAITDGEVKQEYRLLYRFDMKSKALGHLIAKVDANSGRLLKLSDAAKYSSNVIQTLTTRYYGNQTMLVTENADPSVSPNPFFKLGIIKDATYSPLDISCSNDEDINNVMPAPAMFYDGNHDGLFNSGSVDALYGISNLCSGVDGISVNWVAQRHLKFLKSSQSVYWFDDLGQKQPWLGMVDAKNTRGVEFRLAPEMPAGVGGVFHGFDGNDVAIIQINTQEKQLSPKGNWYGPSVNFTIVSHELGHALMDSEMEDNGYSSSEDTAIDESFASTVSLMVKNDFRAKDFNPPQVPEWFNDYEVIPGYPQPAPLTNFKDPKLLEHPNAYMKTNYDLAGAPHWNEEVMNHMFYLLANGGQGTIDEPTTPDPNYNPKSPNAYDVYGIGSDKAFEVLFQAVRSYITDFTDFHMMRADMLDTAEKLYGLKSTEWISVANAWYAVGVGPSYRQMLSYSPTDPAVDSDVYPWATKLKAESEYPDYETDRVFRIWKKGNPNNYAEHKPYTATAIPQPSGPQRVYYYGGFVLQPDTDYAWETRVTGIDLNKCKTRLGRYASDGRVLDFCDYTKNLIASGGNWSPTFSFHTAKMETSLVSPKEYAKAYPWELELEWDSPFMDQQLDPLPSLGLSQDHHHQVQLTRYGDDKFEKAEYNSTFVDNNQPFALLPLTVHVNYEYLLGVRAVGPRPDDVEHQPTYGPLATEVFYTGMPDIKDEQFHPNPIKLEPCGQGLIELFVDQTLNAVSDELTVTDNQTHQDILTIGVPQPSSPGPIAFDVQPFAGLDPGKSFTFYVKPMGPQVYGSEPAEYGYGASRISTVEQLSDPEILNPAEGAVLANDPALPVHFKWKASGSGPSEVDHYDVIVGKGGATPFQEIHTDKSIHKSTHWETQGVGGEGIFDDVQGVRTAPEGYDWKVIAYCPNGFGGGVSSPGAVHHYAIKAAKPVLISPPNGAPGVDPDTVNFQWSISQPAPGGFQLTVVDTSTQQNVIFNQPIAAGTTNFKVSAGQLLKGKSYTWGVAALDGANPPNKTISDPFTFTTLSASSSCSASSPQKCALEFELDEDTNADFDMIITDPTGYQFTYDDSTRYIQDTISHLGPDIAFLQSPPVGHYNIIVYVFTGSGEQTHFTLKVLEAGVVKQVLENNLLVSPLGNTTGECFPGTPANPLCGTGIGYSFTYP